MNNDKGMYSQRKRWFVYAHDKHICVAHVTDYGNSPTPAMSHRLFLKPASTLTPSLHSRHSTVTRPERCAHPIVVIRESGLTIIELELEQGFLHITPTIIISNLKLHECFL